MKLKTLAFAVAILALISGAAYFASRPESAPASDPRVGKALLDTDTAAKTAKMTIVSDQGKALTLLRQADGTWKVSEYFDMPGDFSKISQFVGDLNNAKVDRFVTANPERIARLEFTGALIRLVDAGDKEIWSMALGKNSDSGSGRFVRFGTDPKVYLTGLHLWLDTEAKGWADTQLVNVKPDDIAKVVIPLGTDGSVTLSRKTKTDPWASADPANTRKVKQDAVSPVLSSLGALHFSDSTAPGDSAATEAQKHLATYQLTTFDGKTFTVAIGRKPEEKKLKAPVADAASGPASLGKLADVNAQKPTDAKPAQPEYETIAAGPWFAFVSSSDSRAAVNDLMKKRAFQVEDYSVSNLPKTKDDLFEAAPPPPASASSSAPSTAPSTAPAPSPAPAQAATPASIPASAPTSASASPQASAPPAAAPGEAPAAAPSSPAAGK